MLKKIFVFGNTQNFIPKQLQFLIKPLSDQRSAAGFAFPLQKQRECAKGGRGFPNSNDEKWKNIIYEKASTNIAYP